MHAPAPRALPAVAPRNITEVYTAEELQRATLRGALDVEIRAHLDLRAVRPAHNPEMPTYDGSDGAASLLFSTSPLRSIRGNCSDPDPASTLGLRGAAAAGLLPVRPYQCLVLMSHSLLVVNSGSLWLDNVYLRLHRTTAQPRLAFVNVGSPGQEPALAVLRPARVFATNVTFQAEGRASGRAVRSAAAVATHSARSAVLLDGCVFSDWEGSTSPLMINAQSSAYVADAVFQRARLSVEIADVSGGSTVHFQNASFADVVLAGGAVVSTTANDYQLGLECYLLYDAYDDISYDVDISYDDGVTEVPPPPRPVPARDFRVDNSSMSDCLFLLAPRGAALPGCPVASVETRRRMHAGQTDRPMVDRGGSGPCPVLDGLESRGGGGGGVGGGFGADADGLPAPFVSPVEPWLEAVKAALPQRPPRPAHGTKPAHSPTSPTKRATAFAPPATSPPDAAARIVQPLSLPAAADAAPAAPPHPSPPPAPPNADSWHVPNSAIAAMAGALLLLLLAFLLWLCAAASWRRRMSAGNQERWRHAMEACMKGEAGVRPPAKPGGHMDALLVATCSVGHDGIVLHAEEESEDGRSGAPAAGQRFSYAALRIGDLSLADNPDEISAAYALADKRARIRCRGPPNPPLAAKAITHELHAPKMLPSQGLQARSSAGDVSRAEVPLRALVAPGFGSDAGDTLKPSVNELSTGAALSHRPESEGMAAVSAADEPRHAEHAWVRLQTSVPRASIESQHAQHGGRMTPVANATPRMHYTRTAQDSSPTSGGGTRDSTLDSLGMLPLLSSMARSNRVTATQSASPRQRAEPDSQSRSGADTMALHTLDDETDDIGEPCSVHHAQRDGLSFTISSRITETFQGDLEPPEVSGTGNTSGAPRPPTHVPGADEASASRGGPPPHPQGDAQHTVLGRSMRGAAAVAADVAAAPAYRTLAPTTGIGVSATDASLSELHIRLLMRQLDLYRSSDLFLGRFMLLGREHRRRGGQAVVQFARCAEDGCEFAVKFFLDRSTFLVEAALYAACFPHIRCSASAALAQHSARAASSAATPDNAAAPMPSASSRFLPQVEAVCDGGGEGDGALLRDPAGDTLPPCIVIERGESLQDWSDRADPDFFTALAVLSNVSDRLADMHDAGYVHRDLKPANVMWLPRENRWTVIDFGCVARVGEHAVLNFTLAYAAPEVVRAYHNGDTFIVSAPALDAWSLGVMAFELLTGCPPFRLVTEGRCKVVAQLMGDLPLPWEQRATDDALRKLGAFKGPVLQLLHRDPTRRVSLRHFCDTCNGLFVSRTTIEA